MKISVLIATYNRPEKLKDCLNSILINKFYTFEIIVIDQSSNYSTEKIIRQINSQKIIYITMNTRGKSKALNLGIKEASGEILAFTDDDCLVSDNWLKEINNFFIFNRDKKIMGVFGKALPYEAEKHRGQVCIATFKKKKANIVNKPTVFHYIELGNGNNMSFRKSVFGKVGNFREWLGVGSVSMAGAIEGELIYRILNSGYKLAFVPNILVRHNHWLNYYQEQIRQGKYTCGQMAFYLYYFFKKEKIMKKFIVARIKERIGGNLRVLLKGIKDFNLKFLYFHKKYLIYMAWETICVFRGFLIAIYFTFIKKDDFGSYLYF